MNSKTRYAFFKSKFILFTNHANFQPCSRHFIPVEKSARSAPTQLASRLPSGDLAYALTGTIELFPNTVEPR